MAGQNVGNQWLCIRDKKGVIIGFPENIRKIRCKDIGTVFSAETFVKSVCGKNDPVIEILDQLADFLHMMTAISAAD